MPGKAQASRLFLVPERMLLFWRTASRKGKRCCRSAPAIASRRLAGGSRARAERAQRVPRQRLANGMATACVPFSTLKPAPYADQPWPTGFQHDYDHDFDVDRGATRDAPPFRAKP